MYSSFHRLYAATSDIFPASNANIARFIAYCKLKGFKPNSIATQLAGISYFHKLWGFKSPSNSFFAKSLLSASKNLDAIIDKRLPITIPILRRLVSSVHHILTTKHDRIMVKCMFSLAFFGLLRVGEFTVTPLGSANCLTRNQVKFRYKAGKPVSASLHFTIYKHSKGEGQEVFLSPNKYKTICPVRRLHKYVSSSTELPGPLFHHKNGLPVTHSFFRNILKTCLEHISLDVLRYTPHSFRIGGATYVNKKRMPSTQIKLLGRWKSDSYQRYIRPVNNGI